MIRLARHSLALAQRNLIGVVRNPEALIDVTLQPIIFIALFTFVFGGAIAHGSQHDYLQFLLPGILAQLVAFGGAAIGVNLNTDIEKGVFDRFRSLPIARSAPLIGAVLADIVRYALLCVVAMGFGYALGFRAHTGAPEVLAACLIVIAFALCLSWISVFIGMMARTPGSVQGLVILLMFPLTFGSSTPTRSTRRARDPTTPTFCLPVPRSISAPLTTWRPRSRSDPQSTLSACGAGIT